MKRVLVTGAAGTIGIRTIKYLLSEGKYEVTALDLKNRKHYKKLKKYRKRIDIVYADANNREVIDSLVKESDVIIHLAGTLPCYANITEDMMRNNEYSITKLIVDAIRKYNADCFLIYSSSTSVYEKEDELKSVSSKVKGNCYYSKYKVKAEKYIARYLKNYCIARLSYILGDLRKDNLIYNIDLNTKLEPVTVDNAAYGLVAIIDNRKKLNKRVINITGGKEYRIIYRDLLLQILEKYGITWKIFCSILFEEKNYLEGYFKEEGIDKILQFRTRSINNYYSSLNKYKKDVRRLLPRLIAMPFIWIIRAKNK